MKKLELDEAQKTQLHIKPQQELGEVYCFVFHTQETQTCISQLEKLSPQEASERWRTLRQEASWEPPQLLRVEDSGHVEADISMDFFCQEFGIYVEWASGIGLFVKDTYADVMTTQSLVTDASSFHWQDDDEKDSLLIDPFADFQAFVLQTKDGLDFLLWSEAGQRTDEHKLYLQPVYTPTTLALLPTLDPTPVRQWKDEIVEEDPWMASQMEEYLTTHDPFNVAVAAGLFARLREDSPERRRELVKKMLDGGVDPRQNSFILWAKSLNQQEIRAIMRLAMTQLDMTEDDLHTSEEDELSEEECEEGLLDILQIRDDLDCVYHVIQYHPEAKEKLSERLEDFDLALADSLKRHHPPEDQNIPKDKPYIANAYERILRVQTYDPSAVWTFSQWKELVETIVIPSKKGSGSQSIPLETFMQQQPVQQDNIVDFPLPQELFSSAASESEEQEFAMANNDKVTLVWERSGSRVMLTFAKYLRDKRGRVELAGNVILEGTFPEEYTFKLPLPGNQQTLNPRALLDMLKINIEEEA